MIDENIDYQYKALAFIKDLFQNHGIDSIKEEDKLVFEKQQIELDLRFFDRSKNPNSLLVIQLDVRVQFGIGNQLVESVVGLSNPQEYEVGCNNALENFKESCFHVLLSAFFTSKYDNYVTKYNYQFKNKEYEIVAGDIRVKGNLLENSSYKWFEQFKNTIKNQELSAGIHWIRLFYAQDDFKTTVCEVLLDNEFWIPIQKLSESFDFPKQKDFYSVRLFMIIKNETDIRRVAKFVGSSLSYDDVFEVLSHMGLNAVEIEKAYAFIPEAFGRTFAKQILKLDGNFSNEAGVINDSKDNIDINLTKEPIYTKALQIAQELEGKTWCNAAKQLAMQSACMNVINNALNENKQIEDIDCQRFYSCFYIPSYPKPQVIEK